MASLKSKLSKLGKWFGIVLGTLLVLVLIASTIVYFLWENKRNKTYTIAKSNLEIPAPDSVVLAHGQQIALMYGCTGCHTKTLQGQSWISNFLGDLGPSNLTSGKGGVGSKYTDEDWIRSIRHGVGLDKRSLLVMPSPEFNKLGKQDLQALVAYLKSVPPVDNELNPNKMKFVGRAMMAFVFQFDPFMADQIDHEKPILDVPEKAVSLQHGTYMVQPCQACHGEDLKGQPLGGDASIISSDLTNLNGWTVENFGRAIQHGVRPNGDSLLVNMPRWTMLDDVDIEAIWLYITKLKESEGTGTTTMLSE